MYASKSAIVGVEILSHPFRLRFQMVHRGFERAGKHSVDAPVMHPIEKVPETFFGSNNAVVLDEPIPGSLAVKSLNVRHESVKRLVAAIGCW